MKRLVLAGAGHAHALVLRQLAQAPLAGVEVVVVSPEPLAPYSGMVPGWLAGLYSFDDIVIDMPPLARAAGALWRQTALQALDPAAGNCSWPMARCWTTTCCR
jgi:NADH dehydrogenase FAD-containing subunit